MQEINLKTVKKVHFIGIGGIGISALAQMILHEGKQISGTNDIESPKTLDVLRDAGVLISLEKKIEDIPEDVDLIVYSIAWDLNHPDFMSEVREHFSVPVLTYPEMLGIVSKDKYTIAVAGTHGKTTTTAMIADVLIDAGLSPTVIVGSILSKYKSNFVAGDSEYFVVEACEYKRSFCNINPDILVITNIEADHLDYYKDLEDIKNAFQDVSAKVPDDGYVVSNSGIFHDESGAHQISYSDYIDNVPDLKIPGKHNKENAAGALAVADILKIDLKQAEKSLADFSGTWRRFEYRGKTANGADVYDDYAHHPTEVRATLETAKEEFSGKKIVVVFHPHLYSRTKQFLVEFAEALRIADEVIIAPVFAAREKDDGEGNAEKLTAEVGKKARALGSFEEIKEALSKHGEDVVIFTMGAGDIYKVADEIVSK